MIRFTKEEIKDLSRVKRLNIINSITGIKPANLIGSINKNMKSNLAIFSSVVHLGSNPALIGFILRPEGKVRRHTYENILSNNYYTINHLPNNMTENGHYTSAKFSSDESEFDICNFEEEYLPNFSAPFVKESSLKIGMKYIESVPIDINKTTMVIGSVEFIEISKSALNENGYVDLEELNSSGIGGLNSYYKLSKIESYPYARREEVPNFDK
jgi:flavin reductase (DIM6/NTAB) family NADH-FMN oxidoreductase RutF